MPRRRRAERGERRAGPRPAGGAGPRPAPRLAAWLAPALCVAAAAALRLPALDLQSLVTVDGTEYIRIAESLAAGRPLPSLFPPGYPALVALARLLVPDPVRAAQIVSFAAGVLLPVPVWLLARRAAGAGWATVAALGVALHPELARFSAVTMSESAFVLALYGGLALAAAGRALAAGAALGIAFAVRPEALVTAAALGAVSGARALAGRGGWRGPARGAAGFLLLAVPCWIYFHATLGAWTLTPKLGAFRASVRDWRTEEVRLAAADTARARGAGDLVLRLPQAIAQYPANAALHARSLVALWPWPLLAASLVGLVLVLAGRPPPPGRGTEGAARALLVAAPLAELLALPLLGLSPQPRFVLPALPALAALAAAPPAAWPRPAVRAAAAALWLAGAVLVARAWAAPFRIPLDGSFESHREAGRWLAGASEPGDLVMDRKPYVAFYAGRPMRVLPDEPYERLVRHMVEVGARWVVVDQKVAEIFRRQLEPLLYDAAFREREQRLELAYVGGRARGYGVGVFRVLRPGERKSGRPPVVEARYLDAPRGPEGAGR